MAELHLVLGDKNYSSWSLRPWAWLKQNGVAFSETTVVLGQSDTVTEIQQHNCGNTVPILIDGSVRFGIQLPSWNIWRNSIRNCRGGLQM